MTGVKFNVFQKVIISLIVSITYVIQAVMLGTIISDFYNGIEFKQLLYKSIILLFIMLLRALLVWGIKLYEIKIMGNVKNTVRGRLYNKLAELGPGFLTSKRSGEVESLLVSGIDYLEGYLIRYVPQIFVTFVVSGVITVFLFYIHWILGIIGFLSVFFALIAPRTFGHALELLTDSHWTAYGDLNSELVDGVQGMRTLKAYNQGKFFGEKIKIKMQDLFKKTISSLKLNLADVGVIGLCSATGRSLILGLAAVLFLKGEISVTYLSSLLFLTGELFRPVNELGLYYHNGFMGLTSSKSLFKVLDLDDFIDINGKQEPSKKLENFKLDNVSFSYFKNGENVLKNISFIIKKGERLALVGESGSGKTTIMQLLLRFFDATEGEILYGGSNIKKFNLDSYRKQISVVSQFPYLFTGTIRENLNLANPDATDEELISACKKAQIHDDIMELVGGYDAVVEEGGKNFSGGQRQRISFARALLKDAPILFLDEATSAIDVATEKKLQEALDNFSDNRTVLIIAHRLNTIINADRIIVLDKGKIVEEGTHEKLLSKNGLYTRLFKNQEQSAEDIYEKIY